MGWGLLKVFQLNVGVEGGGRNVLIRVFDVLPRVRCYYVSTCICDVFYVKL